MLVESFIPIQCMQWAVDVDTFDITSYAKLCADFHFLYKLQLVLVSLKISLHAWLFAYH